MQCCGGVSKEKVQDNFLHQVLVPFFKTKLYKKSQLVLSSWACLFTEEICRKVFTTPTKRSGNSDPKVQNTLWASRSRTPHPPLKQHDLQRIIEDTTFGIHTSVVSA
jgi:hypothetical protein